MSSYKHDDADAFFEHVRLTDPKRFAEVASRYPVESMYDRLRAKLGEPLSRSRKRRQEDGMGTGNYVPPEMRRQFTDDEWAAAKEAWQLGEREMDELERLATEQAAGIY